MSRFSWDDDPPWGKPGGGEPRRRAKGYGEKRAKTPADAVGRKTKSQAAPRAWQRMLSGRRLDLLDPSPMDVEVEDIAHGLARVARWNGQTAGDHAFSVAQHSVVVEDLIRRLHPDAPPAWRMSALLHDAAEYVIGDMISPFKTALGVDYSAVERRLDQAVRIRFGLPAEPGDVLKAAIKRADKISAYCEAIQIAGFTEREASTLFSAPPEDHQVAINPLPPRQAQLLFLERFAYLDAALHAGGSHGA